MQRNIIAAATLALCLAALVSAGSAGTSAPATPAPTTPEPSRATTTTTTTTAAPLTAPPLKTPAPTTSAPSLPRTPTPAPIPTTAPGCPSYDNTSANLLDFDVPLACPGPQNCFKAMCVCGGGRYNATINDCVFAKESMNSTTFETCGGSFVQCLVESANSIAASPSGLSKCDSYAVALTREYITLYNAPDKTTTPLYKGCLAVMCNGAVDATGSKGNFSTVCLLSKAAAPFTGLAPATPAPTRMTCPTTQYMNFYSTYVPYMSCGKTLKSCYSSFCSCINGTWSSSTGMCSESIAMVSGGAASKCLATAMSCVLNTALAMYVPMSSTSSSDVCTRWPALVAQSYSQYYNGTSTSIVSGCNASACGMLTTFYAGQLDYASACAFPKTAVPTYVDPIQFSCPDGSKATDASECTCIQAATIPEPIVVFTPPLSNTFNPDSAISGTVIASYRGTAGCANSKVFESFLSYEWTVTDSADDEIATSTAKTLVIPKGLLSAGVTYRIRFRVFGLTSAAVFEGTRTFATSTPAPIVRLKLGSAVRASTQKDITLTAIVTTFGSPSSQVYDWTCESLTNGVQCPTLVETNTVAVIAAGAPVGSFRITFTYSSSLSAGVSKTMTLTTVAAQVPVAQILATSTPVADSNKYLATQSLMLLGLYSSFNSSTVAYSWSIDNVTLSTTTRNAAIALSSYTAGSHTVSLRVTSTADTGVFGESQMAFEILPSFTMAFTVTCADPVATGLSSTLNLGVTGLDSAIDSYDYQLSFSYYVNERQILLPVARDGAGLTFTATAPLLSGAVNASGTPVKFFARLQVNGVEAATSPNATLNIATPNLNDAVDSKISSIQNVRDTSSALDAAATLDAMMQSDQLDETKKKQLATTALNMLVKNVKNNADKLSPAQQSQLLSTFTTSLGTQKSDATQRKVMSEEVGNVLTSMINSATYSFDSAGSTLAALDNCDPSVAGDVMSSFALIMTKDPNLTPGTPKTITAGGLSLTTLKDTPAGLTSGAIKSGGSTVTMGADTFGNRFGADDMIALATTASASNTLAKDGNADPTDGVATFDITKDGVKQPLNGLAADKAIAIGMKTSGDSAKECKYFDTALNAWSTTGVVTKVVDGTVTCYTTHFTAFATFASSSSPASTIKLARCDGGCVAGVVLGSVGAVVILVAVIVGIKKALASPAGTGQSNEPTADGKPNDATSV